MRPVKPSDRTYEQQLQELSDLAGQIGNNFALARLHQTFRWLTQGTRPTPDVPAPVLDRAEQK